MMNVEEKGCDLILKQLPRYGLRKATKQSLFPSRFTFGISQSQGRTITVCADFLGLEMLQALG
jgi:hypothetical protein